MFKLKDHVRKGVRLAAVGAAASLTWVGSSVQAATLSFDPGSTPATPSGGTGPFDNGVANFSNNTSDVAPTSADDAHFAGSPGTVTVPGGGVSVNSVSLDVSGYTINGGTVLLNAVNSTSLSQTVAGTGTINAPIQAANQGNGGTFSTYVKTGGTLTTGTITILTTSNGYGYGAFQKTGAGKLIVNGLKLNHVNSLAVAGGTLQLNGANNVLEGSSLQGGATIGSYQSVGASATLTGNATLTTDLRADNIPFKIFGTVAPGLNGVGTLALNGGDNSGTLVGVYSRSFAMDFTSTSHLAVTLTNPELDSSGNPTGSPVHSTLLLTAGAYSDLGSTLQSETGAVVDIAGGVGGTLVPGTYDIVQFANNASTGDKETLVSDNFAVSSISPQGYSYQFIDSTNGGIDLKVTAVPEPALGLVAFGAGGLLLRRWRRRRT